MTAEQMQTLVRRELGRPADDDRHPVGDLSQALRHAERAMKRQLAMRQHVRKSLVQDVGSVAAFDATGERYVLSATPIYLELWTPPGWNGGRRLYPAVRGSKREGFFILDKTVYLTRPIVYSPGLYVFGIFDNGTVNLESTPKVDSSLPDYLHEVQCLYAAAELARRPHSRIDHTAVMQKASDKLAEVLTTQLFAVPGIEFEDDEYQPWYRGIHTG